MGCGEIGLELGATFEQMLIDFTLDSDIAADTTCTVLGEHLNKYSHVTALIHHYILEVTLL